MKYSIIISPNVKNSNTLNHALNFISALQKSQEEIIMVFLYGHAVSWAFTDDVRWLALFKQKIPLCACSTIAEGYYFQGLKVSSAFSLTGLGQWMESVLEADKIIEFV